MPGTGEFTVPTLSRASHRERKIEDIQVLRGISILLVLLCHFSLLHTLLSRAPHQIQNPCYAGVEIFFIISGYVITRSLIKDQFHAGRFLVRRVFRLLPAVLVFLGLSFAICVFMRLGPFSEAARAEFISNGFLPPWRQFFRQASGIVFGYFIVLRGDVSYYNGPMWSLSVEDQFYWTLALLCFLSGSLLRCKAKQIGRFILGLSALLYVGIALVRCGLFLGVKVYAHVPAIMAYLTNWRFEFLALGIILAFAEGRLRGVVCRVFQQTGPSVAPYLLMGPLCLLAICETPLSTATPWLYGLGMLVTGISFTGLVLLGVNSLAFPTTHGPIYRALVYLGDRSYTMYLFHYPVLVLTWLFVRKCMPRALADNPLSFGVAQAVVGALILLLLCEVVYKYVELPCIQLGKRILGTARHGDVQASATGELDSAGAIPMPKRLAA